MIITTGFTDLSAEAHRNQTAALLATTTTLDPRGTPVGLKVYGGIHSGFDLAKTGALTGTVSAGRAIIPGTDPEDGAWVVTMTEPETFYLTAGNGVHTRRDLVCLKMNEPPEIVEGEDPPEIIGASVVVVKGTGVTGGTTPPTPATPANAIPLWLVPVGPNFTEANGGYPPGSQIDARLRLKLANQDRQPFAMAVGTGTVAMTTTKNYGSVGITFPTNRFRVAPNCVSTLANAPGNSGQLSSRVINVTPTGATIMVYTGDNEASGQNLSMLVNWQAVQMAEDAANG